VRERYLGELFSLLAQWSVSRWKKKNSLPAAIDLVEFIGDSF
jgi:hypothetical protein